MMGAQDVIATRIQNFPIENITKLNDLDNKTMIFNSIG